MGSVVQISRKNTSAKPKTGRKHPTLPFSDKIPFIRSLVLNSVEPNTIKKIYLFGSYAYGKPTKKSDIDLCIIIGNDQDDRKVYMDIAKNFFINNILPYDILIYTENEFSDFSKSSGIENIIFTEGKIIYG